MVDQSRDEELALLRRALQRISRWHGEFPETGEFWDAGPEGPGTRPMSYGAAYGSNGERDYMRRVAEDALDAAAKIEAARQFTRSDQAADAGRMPGDLTQDRLDLCVRMSEDADFPDQRDGFRLEAENIRRKLAFSFPQPQRTRLYEVLRRLGERAIRSAKITDHEAASAAQREAVEQIENLVSSIEKWKDLESR